MVAASRLEACDLGHESTVPSLQPPVSGLWPVLLPLLSLAAPAGEFAERVRADTQWLAGYGTRVVGTEGHEQAVTGLVERVRALAGVRVWVHEYGTVMPQMASAELEIHGGAMQGTHRVFPLWPAGARLNCTPAGGLSGRLVYVGMATPAELPPRSLRGQIAVLEMSAGAAWTNAAAMGAGALLLLDSEAEAPGRSPMTALDAHYHFSPLSLNVPRFYVPAGPLAEALRKTPKAPALTGRLVCQAGWRLAKAANVYALVTPDEQAAKPALAIVAPYDASSVVPELAPGADAALDAALALNALHEFAERPPARPLLFAFVDAFAVNLLGVRQMLGALATVPQEWEDILSEDHMRLSEYREHAELAADLATTPDPLAALHHGRYAPLHSYLKDEVSREVLAIEAELEPLRLAAHGAAAAEKARLDERIRELSLRRSRCFNTQAQLLTRGPLAAELRPLASDLWQRALRRIRVQRAELEETLAARESADRLRRELLAALGLAGSTERPLGFMLGLDISDAGVVAGLLLYCHYLGVDESANANAFRKWLRKIADEEAATVWPADLRRAVDLSALAGIETPDSYTGGFAATVTAAARSFGTPAATWGTLDAPRTRADTPLDTADALDWPRIEPQVEATRRLLERLAYGDDFEAGGQAVPSWSRARGSIVDQRRGEPVARLPMPGYLTTLVPGYCSGGHGSVYWHPEVAGVRRLEFGYSGTDGRFMFDLLPAHVGWYASRFFVQSYLLAADGGIERGVDMAREGRGAFLNIDVRSHNPGPLRAVVFNCRELHGLNLFDPNFLLNLPVGSLLDARRAGKPQRVNFCLYSGQMSGLLEPKTRWQLVMRAGTTRNRMMLINMAPPEEAAVLSARQAMRGFAIGEPLPLPPTYLAARDLHRLDEARLAEYRRAGIVSNAIDRSRKRSTDLLARAEQALAADDGAAFFKAASGALANELRAYQAVRDLANDVARAAVFLLLLLVPFAYAFERLVVATAHIYRQLAGVAVTFGVFSAVLWSFHPAFRISSQPLTIVLAFGVIFMSLLVIAVVYSKFAGGLEELRSGRAEASGAQTSRAGVLGSAVRLGIANMRKRKMRTGLTGVTVVIITFVLLCFTSTSGYTGRVEYGLGRGGAFTGVLVRQPSLRPMPWQALGYISAMLSDGQEALPRVWWCNPQNPQWRLHVRAGGRCASLTAGLGLAAGECALSGLSRLLPDWPRFASGGGCYLPDGAAEQLAVKPGDTVIVAGRELEVIGVYAPHRLDAELRDLDGQLLTPTDYTALGQEQRSLLASSNIELLASELESGSGLEPDMALPRLSSAALIILPYEMLWEQRDCALRSIAIGTENAGAARTLAHELASRFAFPVYFGSPDEARVLAATVLLPEGPAAVLIPLAIGGLIIFNTMLGSIAERRREIHVYTSLGLAPLHVGVLFLAEAATYGLMGAIFGYVVGQAFATLLGRLGLLGGVTLNYSGTQAIATMALVLVVVIVSSLVPAYIAGKVAVPSARMTWSVPAPVGDMIRDTLPFTVTGQTANGVIAYLLEYLDAHREGNIGNFSADNLRVFRTAARKQPARREDTKASLCHGDLMADAGGEGLLGIRGTVWLAPYDLGIRQDVELAVRPAVEGDVYEIDITLRRAAGQTRSWWKLNRNFLGDLRRQLLGWRKLRTSRILEYIAQAAGMLPRSDRLQATDYRLQPDEADA